MGQAPVRNFPDYRPLCSGEEFEQCADLQSEVWGFAERDIVSARMLATCHRFGATLIGAFGSSDRLIGFVFGFPATDGGERLEHSHMLAVLPEFQNQGVGKRLKVLQREAALEKGLKRITWTFDPLVAKNAYLNLEKLGVVVRRYYENLYGESTSSELHSGLGTDRFLAEWHLQGEGEPARQRGNPVPVIAASQQEVLVPLDADLLRTEETLLAEIPSDIQELKRKDPEVAERWRQVTRKVFQHYLEAGYAITGLLRRDEEGKTRTSYVLRKEAAR